VKLHVFASQLSVDENDGQGIKYPGFQYELETNCSCFVWGGKQQYVYGGA
jgi:hypothetical protein